MSQVFNKKDQKLFDNFWLQPGDRVELIREPGEYGTTTCKVLWDDETEIDVQWDNKLTKVNV